MAYNLRQHKQRLKKKLNYTAQYQKMTHFACFINTL